MVKLECNKCKMPANVEFSQFISSNNKIQNYDCPDYVVALLRDIKRKLDIVMWNSTQRDYDSPFENTGNCFICDVFQVYAYSWDDDLQPYNFKCGEIEISWYKYLGRGCTINGQWSKELIIDMYNKCIEKLQSMDEEMLNDENI